MFDTLWMIYDFTCGVCCSVAHHEATPLSRGKKQVGTCIGQSLGRVVFPCNPPPPPRSFLCGSSGHRGTRRPLKGWRVGVTEKWDIDKRRTYTKVCQHTLRGKTMPTCTKKSKSVPILCDSPATEGGGGGLYRVTGPPLGLCRGTVRDGSCTRVALVSSVSLVPALPEGGGVIGCAATRVVTWVSSKVFVRMLVGERRRVHHTFEICHC